MRVLLHGAEPRPGQRRHLVRSVGDLRIPLGAAAAGVPVAQSFITRTAGQGRAMPEFAMLKFNNDTVFEDAAVTVSGLTGNVEFGCKGSGTTFVAVAEGEVWLGKGEYRLTAGMYACVPGPDHIT